MWDIDHMSQANTETLPQLAATIDTLLQHPNFAGLEAFNVVMPGAEIIRRHPDSGHLESHNVGLSTWADSMQGLFPHTAARNLLHVLHNINYAFAYP